MWTQRKENVSLCQQETSVLDCFVKWKLKETYCILLNIDLVLYLESFWNTCQQKGPSFQGRTVSYPVKDCTAMTAPSYVGFSLSDRDRRLRTAFGELNRPQMSCSSAAVDVECKVAHCMKQEHKPGQHWGSCRGSIHIKLCCLDFERSMDLQRKHAKQREASEPLWYIVCKRSSVTTDLIWSLAFVFRWEDLLWRMYQADQAKLSPL